MHYPLVVAAAAANVVRCLYVGAWVQVRSTLCCSPS
jgi:hypothetical protein